MRSVKIKKSGFTLLELILVLAGISVLSAGGFVLYQHTNMQAQTSLAVSDSRLLSNIVMQSYGQSGSFASLNDTSLINGRLLPTSFSTQNNTIQTKWGGTIQVAPFDVNNDTFAITWNKVPSGPCSNMVSQLSKNFPEIQVNNTDVQNSNQAQKLNISTVSSLCGGSDNNQVTLISDAVAQPTTGQPADPTGTGNVPVLPHVVPPKTPAVIVSPSTIAAIAFQTYQPPPTSPPVSLIKPVVTPGLVSNASYNSTPSPVTALPPQTCFPSVTNTPVNTTEYNTQTLACSAGYTGAISQQQTRVQTVTTTNTITCATNWSAPVSTITSATTYTAWGSWVTTGDTCAQMCSTILASASYQPNPQAQYQWANVNPGCPAGYTGTHTYQEQQKSTRSASCVTPSAPVNPVWTAWSAWANTGATQSVVDTCALTCASQLAGGGYSPNPQTQYQWVTVNQGCPAGYVGSKYYQAQQYSTRTASCANPSGTAAPTWGAWSAWANTGATQGAVNTCAPTCNTQLYGGGYPVHYNYQWVTVNVGCPAGYTGSNYYQEQQAQSSSAYCSNPGSTAAPVYGGWSGWWNTGATQGAVNTCVPAAPPSAKALNNCSVTGILGSVNYGTLYVNAPQGTTVIKTCQCPIQLQNNGQTMTVYPSTSAFSTGGSYYGYSSSTVVVGGGTFTVGIMINGTSSQTSSGTKWNSTCQASVALPNGGHYP